MSKYLEHDFLGVGFNEIHPFLFGEDGPILTPKICLKWVATTHQLE